MALSKKALQHKREKKKKKHQAKRSGLPVKTPVVNYSTWPIYECWVSAGLWDVGIGHVVISRKNNTFNVAVGVYLIDVFCLGVKNCFLRITDQGDYQMLLDHIQRTGEDLQLMDAVYANTLIYKAAAYANQFGFKPHYDFAKAKSLLKNITINEEQTFTFGKDGQPFYIQGPNESRSDIKKIMKTLELHNGAGNYHAMLEVAESEPLLENFDELE